MKICGILKDQRCVGVITSKTDADEPKHPHLVPTNVTMERAQGGKVTPKFYNKAFNRCPKAEETKEFSPSDELLSQKQVRDKMHQVFSQINNLNKNGPGL